MFSVVGGGDHHTESRFARLSLGRFQSGPILIATLMLFVVSPLIASGSLSGSAVANMLPFAAILAIVAVGQTLVVQQGGIDLSVPGMVSLGAVLLTQVTSGSDGAIFEAILVVIGAGVLVGLLNGLIVIRLRVTPLVTTLAMNALLLGFVQRISGGFPISAPRGWNEFAVGKVGDVPHLVILAVILIAALGIISKKTVLGRRFEATGENELAARAAGIHVDRMKVGAYVVASVLYASAGALLAGFLQTPSLFVGDTYLLSSIAATVLGGTPLTGGAASLVATGIGALFLSQLNQVIATMGADTSVQLLVQGIVIAVSMAITNISWRPSFMRSNRGDSGGDEPPAPGGRLPEPEPGTGPPGPRTERGVAPS